MEGIASEEPPCVRTLETGKHEYFSLTWRHQPKAKFWIPYCPSCGWVDTEEILKEIEQKDLLGTADLKSTLQRVQREKEELAKAGEMLWTVVANVDGGDWTKQSKEWQEAAARWRDTYFKALTAEAGQEPTDEQIKKAVKKVVEEYGDDLEEMGREAPKSNEEKPR